MLVVSYPFKATDEFKSNLAMINQPENQFINQKENQRSLADVYNRYGLYYV